MPKQRGNNAPSVYDRGFLESQYDTDPGSRSNARRLVRWQCEAAATYRTVPHRRMRYGRGERHAIDILVPHGIAQPPVLLFLHGGYWQRRTREEFAWLAPAWLQAGCAVALVGYPLCPEVSFQRLVRDVVGGIARLWRMAPEIGLSREWVVSGHSAGGHLAATLAATDWGRISPSMPRCLFKGCIAVSGVFDLGPLLATSLNRALRLTAEIAAALSPLHAHPPAGLPAILAVGGAESQEFQRQARDMACAWHQRGADVVQVTLPGCNHFEALEALGRAGSPLFRGALGMIECDLRLAAATPRPTRRRR